MLPQQRIAAIGAGGMGVVYRSHDTRLDRTIGIKHRQQLALGNDRQGHGRIVG